VVPLPLVNLFNSAFVMHLQHKLMEKGELEAWRRMGQDYACSLVAIVHYLPRMTDDFNLLLARLVQLMALDVAMSILLN